MKMKTDLRTRLMTLGILGTVIPLLVVIALVIVQDTNITRIATGQTKELVMANLDNILDCTFEAIRIQQTTLVENLRTSKEGALVTLRRAGRVSQGSEQVAWQAVNQFSKETTSVTLPKLLVGGSWPGQERDPGREVLAVDEIRKLTGRAPRSSSG